ncbi:MAG: hypothetical protein Q9168_004961 [Polycauliona sp. 1 TL-2023]
MYSGKILSDPEEQLLWQDVCEQQGQTSLWLKNFPEACVHFRSKLIARGNPHPPTSRQLQRWFDRAASGRADPNCLKEDIFRLGPHHYNIQRPATESTAALPEEPRMMEQIHPMSSGQPKKSSKDRRNKSRKRNLDHVPAKIGSEGVLSDAPCQPCATRGEDCLVHIRYARCQFCTSPLSPESYFHTKRSIQLLGTMNSRQLSSLRAQPSKGHSTRKDQSDMHRGQHNMDSDTPALGIQPTLASPEGMVLDRIFGNIETLMGEDPKSYLPKDTELRSLREDISSKIDSSVTTWLATSNTGRPQFLEAVRNPASFQLLRRIYSTGNKEELMFKIARMSFQYPIDTGKVLRAMMGAAVFEWVFEGHHRWLTNEEDNKRTRDTTGDGVIGGTVMLPSQLSGSHSMFQKLLSKISPELQVQLECKSRYLYVKEDPNVDIHAQELASRMSLVLEPFDLDKSLGRNEAAIDAWFRHLTGAFKAAIRLKLYTSLQPHGLVFRWPHAEEVFDSRWMQGDADNLTECTGPVHLALFPAMFRIDEATSNGLTHTEPPVFHAVVLQQL